MTSKLPADRIISPYTNPAEVELIGMLLNHPETVRDCETLTAEHFQEPRHWNALQAIRRLQAAGHEVSPLTVAEALDPQERAEYAYLDYIAKERGFYRGELVPTRVLILQREAINRACKRAASAEDWGSIAELRKEWERIGQCRQTTMTAAELLAKEFPPLRWLVEGILPEGVTLLAAAPKMGKTRMAMQLAIAIACGGYALNSEATRCQAAEVLYLALESGERRLQKDLREMHDSVPVGLHLATTWRRLAEGGSADLDAFLERHPGVKLVLIDTFAQARSATHGDNGFLYSADYLAGATIKELADRRGISILVIHHTRKGMSDDPLETVSGSQGVTGSVDHVLILKRQRPNADGTLFLSSRDYPECQWALSFEKGLWTLLGTPQQASAAGWSGDGASAERRRILEILAKQPMKPADLAERLGKNPSTTRVLLMKLAEADKVYRRFDGCYAVLPEEPHKLN